MTFPGWVSFLLVAILAGIEYTQQYKGFQFVEPIPFLLGLGQVLIGVALGTQRVVTETARRMLGRPKRRR